MMKFPNKDRTRRLLTDTQPVAILEVFRDSYRSIPPFHNDPVVVFGVEMQELKRTDKKHRGN